MNVGSKGKEEKRRKKRGNELHFFEKIETGLSVRERVAVRRVKGERKKTRRQT